MSTTASQGTYLPILEQEISATKDKRVNILGFEGHTISVVTTQLSHAYSFMYCLWRLSR